MPFSLATYALWVAPILVLIFLAVTMFRRNLRTQFPVFFTYTVVQIVMILATLTSYHISYKFYFCTYWLATAADVLLGLAVIREVFANLFRQYDALRDLGSVLFRWAAVVLIMVAVINAASGATSRIKGLTLVVLALERSVRVMQCGLVLLMFLFSAHLRITSKHKMFGVAFGFGLFASVELMIVTLYALGTREFIGLNLAKTATYLIATGIWAFYMVQPEPEPVREEAQAHTERWNLALASIRDPEYNFLPMVESVVERVLNQRHIEVEHSSEE